MKKSLLILLFVAITVTSVFNQTSTLCDNFRNYAPYPYENDYYAPISFQTTQERIDYFIPHFPILNIQMIWHIMLDDMGGGPITSWSDQNNYLSSVLADMNYIMYNLSDQTHPDFSNPSPNIQDSRIRYAVDENHVYFETNGEADFILSDDALFDKYVDSRVGGASDEFKFNCVHVFIFAGANHGGYYTSFHNSPNRVFVHIDNLNTYAPSNYGFIAKTINHELGHCWGLHHITTEDAGNACTYDDNDNIEDTPFDDYNQNPCVNEYPCIWDGECVGNNMMHPNVLRNSLTRYQLGRMHFGIINNIGIVPDENDDNGAWNMVIKDYCEITDPTIEIYENEIITWKSTKILRSDIEIYDGGQLTIMCKVHMPDDARITIRAGGKLIIDGG